MSTKPYQDKYHLEGGQIIRQITFGMNDGIVSVFALLAGVAGAGQEPNVILISMLAATIAGALSMAAGEFISGKGEHEYYAHEIENERLEIKLCPDIELEELRIIYRKKGFEGEILEKIVHKISQNHELWVREMVIEELGTTEIEPAPTLKESLVIFISFILGAIFPVLPYAILTTTSIAPLTIFWIATIVTFSGLFFVGAMKTKVTGMNWIKSGIEMLVVGVFAFSISYLVGMIFNI